MKLSVFLASVCILLTSGCQITNTIKESELKHHNFKLQTIDNKPVKTIQVVNIEFIEAMRVNGFTGCNRFFGQAILKKGKFKIDKIGMTRKSCDEHSNKIETYLIDTLSNWSDVTLENRTLNIIGNHKLVFKMTTDLNKIMDK
ncbi:hypothetical protein CJF42_21435 [Pseudoalteromonas sp. NBT06-2]|uniref:META domain-containing protein n=1 Tax=Pseudoalteromonas sp. NBT06-2 TaxID=2025950 RepID=UPI000BA7C5EE|nr:META domain-containing protein [Pseudoalteromonas sp. NBT06-2]PAJ72401.1 hypothetical protein CJF42_21435 [Pseudoalteromonas sp. NBT06-2]